MLARILSLSVLVAVWFIAAALAHSRLLPGPLTVAGGLIADIRTGELPYELGCTLARVAAAFTIALILGSVVGFLMGRSGDFNRYADPWLIILINLPALVTIIFAYIWIGLNETAAILAVALNKLPNMIVVVREGARTLDPKLDDMASVFRMPLATRIRHVIVPQIAPYLAAGARSGLSIIWKLVLVVELIGRPNGVGFVMGSAFSLFDMTKLLSYAISFIVIMLVIEHFVVQPIEQHTFRWRRQRA